MDAVNWTSESNEPNRAHKYESDDWLSLYDCRHLCSNIETEMKYADTKVHRDMWWTESLNSLTESVVNRLVNRLTWNPIKSG